MISRRELFIGATALAVRPGRRVSLTLGVGDVAVRLEDVEVDVLTGVPARLLSPAAPASPVLTIEVSRARGRLRWHEPERTCEVWFPAGVTGFVAAWALPLARPSLIGVSGDDLVALLRRGRATFWPAVPGSALASAAACHVCYLGAWDLTSINRHAMAVEGRLAPSADFIFADSLSALEPTAPTTVFG